MEKSKNKKVARNKEFEKINNLKFSEKENIIKFIDLYIKSEIFAKKLQSYYQKDMNNNQKGWKQQKIDVRTLKKALDYFQLSFSIDDIDMLFSSKNKTTAKELRNKYIHTLSNEKAIENNAKKHIERLHKFLKLRIKNI